MRYPNMQTKELEVNGIIVLTDSEGYIVDSDEWSEDFVRALAKSENLSLTGEHLEVVKFLRAYYELHRVQCEVRKIVKHFKKHWEPEKANSSYLHKIFPRGGPQKQGNRLAGLLRTKGEH
ncbi:MAG: TusE/DsrC/DsvC family sulfur relay protein [Gammaproteobacteria bacterium]